jgi:hypothetical protein
MANKVRKLGVRFSKKLNCNQSSLTNAVSKKLCATSMLEQPVNSRKFDPEGECWLELRGEHFLEVGFLPGGHSVSIMLSPVDSKPAILGRFVHIIFPGSCRVYPIVTDAGAFLAAHVKVLGDDTADKSS